jgi:hypothetical protein
MPYTYSIGPLIRPVQHSLDDTATNDLAQAPAKVDVCSQVASESDGADLGRVGDGQGLEDAPRDPAQDLGDLQVNDGLRCEEDSDETADQHKAGHDRVAVAKALRDVAIDEQAEDLAHVGTVAKTGLPGRRDLVSAIGQLVSVFLVELGEAWVSEVSQCVV